MKVTTKFNRESISTIGMYGITMVVIVLFLGKTYKAFSTVSLYSFVGAQVLFYGLLLVCLLLLNSHKKISIDIQEETLKYSSLFRPLGKTLSLKDYKSWMLTEEHTLYSSIKVVYLLNHKMTTAFKINTSLYKNSEKLISALKRTELTAIESYNLGTKNYIRLLFTGKLTMVPPQKKHDKKTQKSA